MDIIELLTLAFFFSLLCSFIDFFAVNAYLALELVLEHIGNTVTGWAGLGLSWQESSDDNIWVEARVDL